MSVAKKLRDISLFSGIGGLDLGDTVLDVLIVDDEKDGHTEVERRDPRELFLQRRYDEVRRAYSAMKKENARLYERIAQAEKWKVMYDRLWDFLLRAYPFDVGMRKELLKVAAAVDDKEREQQLRDSLKEDLRPQGMVVGNMYGGVVGDTVNGLPFR